MHRFVFGSKKRHEQENGDISLKSDGSIRRLVNKDGEFHVSLERIGCFEKFRRYVSDCFTTFIDIKWRWTLLIIVSGYFVTWLIFATVYYIFGVINGDINDLHTGDNQRCVSKVHSFTTALLFSVESQHTIGYGSRVVTELCPHVIAVVFFQFIFGVGIQCLIAGLFFAKLQRAKKRSETIMFSRMACIGRFNGKLYLTVRVGNLRSSLLLGVRAMGMLVKKRLTTCGDEIPLTQHHIDFYTESNCDSINLLWPTIIYHPIDQKSPLYNTNHSEVLSGYSELIVVLEGVMDSTSKTFQARTSYLPPEVYYDYRFKSIAPTPNSDGAFQISYFDFNMVIPVEAKPKRLLIMRDSSSQTVYTNDVTRPLSTALKNWRSLNDVARMADRRKDSLNAEFTACPVIPDESDQSTTVNNPHKSNTIDNRDNSTPSNNIDENDANHDDVNDYCSKECKLGQKDDPTTMDIVHEENLNAQNGCIVKRSPCGRKTFQVLKLPDGADT